MRRNLEQICAVKWVRSHLMTDWSVLRTWVSLISPLSRTLTVWVSLRALLKRRRSFLRWRLRRLRHLRRSQSVFLGPPKPSTGRCWGGGAGRGRQTGPTRVTVANFCKSAVCCARREATTCDQPSGGEAVCLGKCPRYPEGPPPSAIVIPETAELRRRPRMHLNDSWLKTT